MAKNFPNLIKDISLQIKSQQTADRIKKKKVQTHPVKFLKIGDLEKILKVPKDKCHIQQRRIQVTTHFSSETREFRKPQSVSLKCLRKKMINLETYSLQK